MGTASPDPRRLLLSELKIRTKDKRVIPFQPNAVQRLYLEQILPGWEECPYGLTGLREILLKARQFGFSTLILGLFFLETVSVPNTQTVVIAHDTDTTERLFQTVQRFYRLLPESRRPKTQRANRREFLWPELDSYFFVGTAGSGEFGRGGTINNVHGSEVAFWPNADDLIAGLLQAVPADGNVFLETTANGLGNWFYTEYQAAEAGDSAFTPRFFGWWQHREYRSAPQDGFSRTEEEDALSTAYGLDDAQLNWRRGKVKELREKFPQEYPANAAEAFLSTGNPYFDRDRLKAMQDALQGPEFAPVSAEVPEKYRRLRSEVRRGLTVWEVPRPGRVYVIGADTAEGLTDGGDHDYDCADVFDAETWTQVAHLHGLWDTHEYGLLLAELGRWYNTAVLAIERNNHGHAVINAALHGDHYPPLQKGGKGGLYYHEEYDETKKLSSRRPGWPTTPKTKYFALDGLATSIENGDLKLRSRHTVKELLTYVKKPGGQAGGEGKSHDDAVISAAIADAMLKLRPHHTGRPAVGGSRPSVSQARATILRGVPGSGQIGGRG